MVTINGKEVDMSGKTISQYLEIANYNPKTIAVECNEVIISKSDYETTVLKDGDVVEVVSFMGGGKFLLKKNKTNLIYIAESFVLS